MSKVFRTLTHALNGHKLDIFLALMICAWVGIIILGHGR